MKSKIIILLFIIFLLTGCGNYRELNNISIITGVAIDKKDDKYLVSYLIANSQRTQSSSKEGESQTTVYSGEGKNLVEATKQVDYKSPKKLYFGHIEVVVISEEIAKEGFFNVSDFLLRYPETRKQFFLMQAKDCKAKDILTIVSPLESFPAQSITTLLKTNKDTQSVATVTDYSSFIGNILKPGVESILPVVTIKGDIEDGSKDKNVESTELDAYLKLSEIAIFKEDKFTTYGSFYEGQAINIVNNDVSELKTTFSFKNSLISYNSNNIKTKINIKDTNNISLSISGSGFLSEVDGNIDLESTKVIKEMEKTLNKKIKKQVNKTINKMKDNKTDVFGFGNMIYKKYPKKWEKLEDKWNDKYFPNLNIKIKANLTIKSSGSLDKVAKEVQSETN